MTTNPAQTEQTIDLDATALVAIEPDDSSARRPSRITFEVAGSSERLDVEGAIVLGNAAAATVGFLPRSVYLEAAAKKRLLLARDSAGRVVGYALYRVTATTAHLTHLVVDPAFQNRGVGRGLVERLSDLQRDRAGSAVWCRWARSMNYLHTAPR